MEARRTFTRNELYELVWSKPISQLAASFDLSDRGLAKICERHHIPVPGRGYWAKIEAGQPATKTPLWKIDHPSLESVHIGSKHVTASSDYLAHVLAAAKAGTEVVKGERAPKPAKPLDGKAPVAKPSAKMHDEVWSFLVELRRLPPDRDGFVYLKYVRVPPAAINRVGNLLNGIAAELHPYGFMLDSKTNRLGFSKDGCSVDFGINAPRKRKIKKSRTGDWNFHEYEHVGRMEFKIYGRAEGSRKNWIDTDGYKIEEALGQIADSFLINHVAEREYEEKRMADEARRAHLAHRRELAELRDKREEDRLEFLTWIAGVRREIEDLKATIAMIPQTEQLPQDYERMLAWAQHRLSDLESSTTVDRIQSVLVERSEPDHLFDPEGEPPPMKNYWDE